MKVLSTIETQASVKITDETPDDYAILKGTGAGRKIWTQNADPAGSAIDGDVWIQIP